MPDPTSSSDPRIPGDLDAVDAALDGRAVKSEHRALADLAVLLRDERPTPDADAARRLDERIAASLGRRGARAPDGPPRRGRRLPGAVGRSWWPALAAAACLLLAAVVVLDELRAGTPPGQGDGSSAGAAREALSDGRGEGAELQASEPGAAADSAAAGSVERGLPVPPGGSISDPTDTRERRLVERSAFLTLTTEPDDLADVASRIVRATDDAGGYVASSTVGATADDRGSASFELRVPAGELPRTLAALSRLAQVTERSESTRDITADVGATARRLAELRAERRRLLRALGRAGTDEEAARIRARLRAVARRTAAVRASGRRLRNRAAFATISVNLVADADAGAAVGDGRWTPGDAVRTAVRVLEIAVGVALVAAALAVPLAIVAVVVMLMVRVTARRRRSRVLDAS